MRANDLVGKEVIAVNTGEKLGVIQKSELLINTTSGMVEALIFVQQSWSGREKEIMTIPWGDIQKISEKLIIFNEKEQKG